MSILNQIEVLSTSNDPQLIDVIPYLTRYLRILHLVCDNKKTIEPLKLQKAM